MIGWQPSLVFQVGLGMRCEEARVMRECWDSAKFHGCDAVEAVAQAQVHTGYPGIVHHTAVGGKDLWDNGTLNVGVANVKPKHKDGSSMLAIPNGVRQEKTTVLPLDSFKFGGEEVLLWLDCEGSELSALKSGKEFLKQVKMINVEMTGSPPCESWPSPEKVHRFLVKQGFFRVWQHTNRLRQGQYDSIYVTRDLVRPKFVSDIPELQRWREATVTI